MPGTNPDETWTQPTLYDGTRRHRYTLRQFMTAVAAAENYSDVCRSLGLVPRGANYDTVRRYAARHGVDVTHLERAIHRHEHSREEVVEAFEGARSKAEVLRRLGRAPRGGAYRWLDRLVQRLGIEPPDLPGQAWAAGQKLNRRVPTTHYLVVGPPRGTTSELRERLIEDGFLPARCASCHRGSWLEVPIPLELDHVNGDREDNRLENVRLLCPNCHALTPTYRGRNIGRRRDL